MPNDMKAKQLLNYSAATNPGLQRDNNEDCYLSLPEQGLWLVADGMGGHEAGEVASAIVRDTLKNSNGKTLPDAIQASHQAVLKAAEEGVGAEGMGSTIVALLSHNHEYEVAWVGDSRAYLWTPTADGGRLEQLSTDHSYVQMLVSSGAISADDMGNHPDKNIITQCLGSQELAQVQVDSVQGQWKRDQRILLCSDGLTDEVDDKHIAQILCDSRNSRVAVNRLLRAALKNGGKDNITVQVIESPLSNKHPLAFLWQWVPVLTGRRQLDAALYGTALVSLLLLLYWILF